MLLIILVAIVDDVLQVLDGLLLFLNSDMRRLFRFSDDEGTLLGSLQLFGLLLTHVVVVLRGRVLVAFALRLLLLKLFDAAFRLRKLVPEGFDVGNIPFVAVGAAARPAIGTCCGNAWDKPKLCITTLLVDGLPSFALSIEVLR